MSCVSYIPKYFCFEAIVNGIVFLISPQPVHKKSYDLG
jgi:hypothetical protein